MKLLYFIPTFLISSLAFAQIPSITKLASNITFNSIDSILWIDFKNGFVRNNSDCHCFYKLDSNLTFKLFSLDCISRFIIDTGLWEIKNNNKLVLKSKAKTMIFKLVKVWDCMFFVQPNEFQTFKKDLTTILATSKYTTTSRQFSWRLKSRLGKKYFCR